MTDSYPISVALLSYGMSGRVFHAPFIHAHPGFKLAGAWERTAERIRQDYPDAIRFTSLEEVLDSDVRLVVVNTPTGTHFSNTLAAIKAGKDVIVEKAFTATLPQAIELQQLARSTGRKIAVFQNRRWDSDFLAVREVLESGKIGTLVEAQFCYDRYSPGLSPKVHKETPSPGAGVLRDLGPHLIDQALTCFGLPEGVFADIRITRAHSQVDDYFELLLYYPSFRVRLHSGYFNREPWPAYVLHGTLGSFHHLRTDVQEAALQAGKKPGTEGWGADASTGLLHRMEGTSAIRELTATPAGNYMQFYDGVWKALDSDTAMPVTATDGVHVMMVIDAAERSANTGSVVSPDWKIR